MKKPVIVAMVNPYVEGICKEEFIDLNKYKEITDNDYVMKRGDVFLSSVGNRATYVKGWAGYTKRDRIQYTKLYTPITKIIKKVV